MNQVYKIIQSIKTYSEDDSVTISILDMCYPTILIHVTQHNNHCIINITYFKSNNP